jgi:predicted ABC-type ATPase
VSKTPQLLIVGGPNGSGKTTVALEYSNERNLPYVSADALAAALNPTNPQEAQFTAARQYKETLDRYVLRQVSCVCESTLSGLTMQKFMRSAHDAGFSITIAFLFVESVDICLARVAERVRKGGHDVPEDDIRRRFSRSLGNFWRIYRQLADNWVLLYNGIMAAQDVSAGAGQEIAVHNPQLYSTFLKLVGGTQ